MTYEEFHNIIINSEPHNWRYNGERHIYLPDIDIQLFGDFNDPDVPDIEDKERFDNYVGTSRYKLYYHSQFITGNNFVSTGDENKHGTIAIPFPFVYADDFKGKTAYCSVLDFHVCYLLSNMFGDFIYDEDYAKVVASANVKTLPYRDGIWFLEEATYAEQ